MLIAFEFIRKFKDIQALVAMSVAWPLRSFVNAMSVGPRSTKMQKVKKSAVILIVVYALLFLLLIIPLTVVFYLVNLIGAALEEFHNLVNRFYLTAMREYRPTYGFWTKILLRSSEKYEGITEQKVIKELQKREIPVLPIAGVILITIAFIMQIA